MPDFLSVSNKIDEFIDNIDDVLLDWDLTKTDHDLGPDIIAEGFEHLLKAGIIKELPKWYKP